jgi:hypothetical protein
MTSADSLSLILRRFDEIERKLDRMMEDCGLPLPSAIRYGVQPELIVPRLRLTVCCRERTAN